MKITIIGAGNMGGAIALGLMQSQLASSVEITVTDLDNAKLAELSTAYPAIKTSNDNASSVNGADIVIVAVKPWLVDTVLSPLTITGEQILISIAAGVTFQQLSGSLKEPVAMFRVIPNTAIRKRESTSLIASCGATQQQEDTIVNIFEQLGMAMIIKESQMSAGTALSSCGIAYVFQYVHAATSAGVEMGLTPREAMRMVAQSLKGAAEILLEEGAHPAVEIDKVTTPGGVTIKGINTLHAEGFNAAIIKAMKASV